MIQRVLAQCTVTDLVRAEPWYTTVLDQPPDARPMEGLLEWDLREGAGLQVWSEPERAGRSSVVLEVADLDAAASRLDSAGIVHDGPQPGGGVRILPLIDPDGNRVVLAGR